MSKRYFLKVNLLNELQFGDDTIRFQPTGNNLGVAAFDEGPLADYLGKLHVSRIGGVVEITKEQYDTKKKEPVIQPVVSIHIPHTARAVNDNHSEVPGFVKSSPASDPQPQPAAVEHKPKAATQKRARRTAAVEAKAQAETPPEPEVGLP